MQRAGPPLLLSDLLEPLDPLLPLELPELLLPLLLDPFEPLLFDPLLFADDPGQTDGPMPSGPKVGQVGFVPQQYAAPSKHWIVVRSHPAELLEREEERVEELLLPELLEPPEELELPELLPPEDALPAQASCWAVTSCGVQGVHSSLSAYSYGVAVPSLRVLPHCHAPVEQGPFGQKFQLPMGQHSALLQVQAYVRLQSAHLRPSGGQAGREDLEEEAKENEEREENCGRQSGGEFLNSSGEQGVQL